MRRLIDVERATALYAELGSLRLVGERLGFAGTSIWSALTRVGVSLRAPGGRAGPLGEASYCWKGDAARDISKRQRAHRLYPELGPCSRCGEPASDRHHKDADTGNNAPENVAFLCRRCHMETDGRLERFTAMGHAPKPHLRRPPSPCANCKTEAPSGKRRKGRCHACDMFLRRTGRERPHAARES